MIHFLHPVFTILTIVLVVYSFLEVNNYKNYNSVWVVIVFLTIFIGLRFWIGADYGIYFRAYHDLGKKLDTPDILNIVIEGKKQVHMEWLYLLFANITYEAGFSFYIFTFLLAIVSISIKYKAFTEHSVYPAFAMLLFMYPTLLISDGGQMRQGMAMAILLFSFRYIKERKLLMFLSIAYLAISFHTSSAVFIIAYWIVLIPMNSTRILIVVLVCIALSPLKLYQYVSLLDSLASTGVYSGFQSYETLDIEETSVRFIKLSDLICILYTYFLVTYDKAACQKIPYYEYMRNIGVLGICLYFIFRWNEIFSSRLVANFLIYMPMVLVNIVAAVSNDRLRKSLQYVLLVFVVFQYFVYANQHGLRTGYTMEYRNLLWSE
ncbi:MAG: EpsG family protein [Flavobacteriaceae bacterium]|nr:EpsG family protein [Flavobacteriaceae bacterium]